MSIKRYFSSKNYKDLAWSLVSIFINRGLAFLSIYVCGLFLTIRDFEIIGIVNVAQLFSSGFTNNGIKKIIVAGKNENGDRYLKKLFYDDILLSSVGSCLILIYGFNALRSFENAWVVIIITAFSLPLINASFFLESTYLISSKFKSIALKSSLTSLIYHCFISLFAVLGLGYLSIACATILEFITRILLYSKTFSTLLLEKFNSNPFKAFFAYKNSILYGFLLAFSSRGELLLISNFTSESFFGNYVFSITLLGGLAVAVTQLIDKNILSIVSKKVKSNGWNLVVLDSYSQKGLYISKLFCVLIFLFLPVISYLVWGEKWLSSNLILIAISLVLPYRIISQLYSTALIAQGRWRDLVNLLIIQVCTIPIFFYIGVVLKKELLLLLCLCSQRLLASQLGYDKAARPFSNYSRLSLINNNFIKAHGLYFITGTSALILYSYFFNKMVVEGTNIDLFVYILFASLISLFYLFASGKNIKSLGNII